MSKTINVIGWVILILGICLIIISAIFGVEKPTLKEVDCYDRYNNKIMGQICIEDKTIIKEPWNYLMGFGFLFEFISILFFGLASVEDYF